MRDFRFKMGPIDASFRDLFRNTEILWKYNHTYAINIKWKNS